MTTPAQSQPQARAQAQPGTSLRYAVVEDEAGARRVLVKLVSTLAPDWTLAWEAEEGEAAFRRLLESPVDVVFLDIVFPPDGAFGFLERVRESGQGLPEIVFVTSLEDQARKAFDWAACDYLVKPLATARMKETLERLRTRRAAADRAALLAAVKGLAQGGPERFTVALRDRILVFRWSEVMYLHTDFRQVFAHTARGKVPLDRTLDELELLLGEGFCRIHRSTLVNLDYLVEVHTPGGRAGEALMQDGALLSVSRPRLDALLRRLARMR